MSDEETFNISIPTDSEGFVVLQCSLCKEFFKITSSDFEDEAQLKIWCPKCGLNPDSLITSDVIELATKIVNNHVIDLLDDFDKNLKKMFKSGSIKYKSHSKLKKEPIDPLFSKVDNLESQIYECCNKEAKISTNLKIEGGYCPFCGEMQDGN